MNGICWLLILSPRGHRRRSLRGGERKEIGLCRVVGGQGLGEEGGATHLCFLRKGA